MKKQSEIVVKYLDYNTVINLGHYQDGSNHVAMLLDEQPTNESQEPENIAVVSTNLPIQLADDEIAVNETGFGMGLLNLLVDEEILTPTNRTAQSGFNTYRICKFNFEIDKPFIS